MTMVLNLVSFLKHDTCAVYVHSAVYAMAGCLSVCLSNVYHWFFGNEVVIAPDVETHESAPVVMECYAVHLVCVLNDA